MEHDINLMVVVTPVSTYYKDFFNMKYKSIFYDILDSAPNEIHVLDFWDFDDMFEDEDFNDTDHLSEFGAEKVTYQIAEFIKQSFGMDILYKNKL